MNKINFPIYGWVGIASVCMLSACNDSFMDRLPQTEIGVESYFNTEEDLKMYCYGLTNTPGYDYTADANGNVGSRVWFTTPANASKPDNYWDILFKNESYWRGE